MTFFRILWFVIKLALLVGVAVYLANRPGNLSLVWFGYRLDLHPIALSLLGVLLCLGILYVIGRLVARVVAVPGDIGAMRGHAREAKGYQALTRGLAAAAAGDAREAKRLSVTARKLLSHGGKEPPITRLLAAQAAQLEGDDVAAQVHFKALAETPETAILGLRGLALGALKDGNVVEARRLAERALAANPNAQWAAETALRLQAKAGRFDAADESLKAVVRAGALNAKTGQRRRAALLTEKARQALIVDGTDVSADIAMSAAREAVKLAGDFAPARFVLVRLMVRQGKALYVGISNYAPAEAAEAIRILRALGTPMRSLAKPISLPATMNARSNGPSALSACRSRIRITRRATASSRRPILLQSCGAKPAAISIA